MEQPARAVQQQPLQLLSATEEALELLSRGMASAEHLESLVKNVPPPVPALVAHIRESFDRALSLLKPPVEVCRKEREQERPPSPTTAPVPAAEAEVASNPPLKQTPPPPSPTKHRPQMLHPQKRRRADQSSLKRMVVKRKTMEDGFVWRKYGEKNILNSKHPRCYFRCTHKYERNCEATKHVQQSEDNPGYMVVTYIGEHTCVEPSPPKDSSSFIISFNSNSTPIDEQRSKAKFRSPSWSVRDESCCDNKEDVTRDHRPPPPPLSVERPRAYDVVDVDGSESSGGSTRSESGNDRTLDLNLNLRC